MSNTVTIRVLLVDDHRLLLEALQALLEGQTDLEVVGTAHNGVEAIQAANETRPDVVVMDISMPELDGISATRQIMAEQDGVRVLALSMHSELHFVEPMLHAGSSGFLLKDCGTGELAKAVRVVARGETYLSPEIQDLRPTRPTEEGFHGILGRDPRMLQVFDIVRQVAPIAVPVLIQGETGTGKEMVARALHREGSRAEQPLITVNCAALPESLLESELFGHVRGAFTDASRDRKGRFEVADGGTVFLDEIGELTPSTQVKLLRVLQFGTFEPVGSDKTTHVDVRLLCATSRDLESEIDNLAFRPELYYRLCVIPISLPPLRERGDDVLLLARHLLTESASVLGLSSAKLSRAAERRICDYSWPGNVRELRNAMQHALIKARGSTVDPAHLPPAIADKDTADPLPTDSGRKRRRSAIEDALGATGGNKVKAAKLLGISRATLYRWITEEQEREAT